MRYLNNKADIAAQLQLNLMTMAHEEEKGYDITRMLQILAGLLVETVYLFDDPDVALEASFTRLSETLGTEPADRVLQPEALPPSYFIDFECECGRALARVIFEDWLECEYDFHDLILYLVHYNFCQWQDSGQSLGESFRLFIEFAVRCMAYEIAAQELCDLVIDRKIGSEGWTLGDCISGLSAMAGRRIALSVHKNLHAGFRGANLPEQLDHIAYVMTQEAVRLGVSAGSDWRFGLAANDMPVNAPVELIMGLEPQCQGFFKAVNLPELSDQAVGCAKAAGRMIAVATLGELPEIEPVIAKPLAMAAMTESYKSVCLEHAIISC
jgi:hypothetical protein